VSDAAPLLAAQALAAIAGVCAALGWGSADFIARYTGRALGLARALFGMLLVSAALMWLLLWWLKSPVDFIADGRWQQLWLVVIYGLGLAAATGLLYAALSRGPVAVAAPLVGSFPAFSLLIAVALGALPSAAEWLAMALVMAGVLMVARAAGVAEDAAEGVAGSAGAARGGLRGTVLIALCSALLFAITLAAMQEAALHYGELQSVAAGRALALFCCALLVLWQASRRAGAAGDGAGGEPGDGRRGLILPLAWWPALGAQGVLDGGAYIAIAAGSEGAGSVITPVIASAFSAVTVLLARLVLKEPMSAAQWLGVGAIVCGVAWLSALGQAGV